MTSHILAIDQGTTSSRAIIFTADHQIIGMAQQEFKQYFPRSGWVEHDPEEIWATTLATCRRAMEQAGLQAGDIAAVGITNQRETTLIWDRRTGRPIHNAIVWQDRRTGEVCNQLKAQNLEEPVSAKTGLLLDPYFSATKAAWILDRVEGARTRAEQGELAFGTVDSFLLWRLTGGRVHATDATNAARTLLFNIHENRWDEELLEIFQVPQAMLPRVMDCAADFGTTDPDLFGGPIRICGMAGDQQAALIGQACFDPGMAKSTYGTGCFAILNTGTDAVRSGNRLLTTIAYRLDGKTTYGLEGSIFIAGAAVQWLRDGLGIISAASESGPLARRADSSQQVYLVPAFTGLGAPYWDAESRGAIFGLTRSTGPAELARAALEAVCYQTRDLLQAMRGDWQQPENTQSVLRVDGGMVASNWTMQFLADILNTRVDRPRVLETTALGAAYLAGLQAGVCPHPEEFAQSWKLETRFTPAMNQEERTQKYTGWQDAVGRTLTRRPAAD
jgi:glycerol kinase